MQAKNKDSINLSDSDCIITDNDILFGRGRAIESHMGNRVFRQFIRQYAEEYANADRDGKTTVLRNLLQCIQEQHIRMFKRKGSEKWHQVNTIEMKHKIGHALRDLKVSPKTSMTRLSPASDAANYCYKPLYTERPTMAEVLEEIQKSKMILLNENLPVEEVKLSRTSSIKCYSPVLRSMNAKPYTSPTDPVEVQNARTTTTVSTSARGMSQFEFPTASLGGNEETSIIQDDQKKVFQSPSWLSQSPTRLDIADPMEPVSWSENMALSANNFLARALDMNDSWTRPNTHQSQTSLIPSDYGFKASEYITSPIEYEVGVDGLSCSAVKDIFDDFVNSAGSENEGGIDSPTTYDDVFNSSPQDD